MHPLLSHRRWLLAYLAAWAALAVVPAFLVAYPHPTAFPSMAVLFVPLTVGFGLTTLPLLYLCRAFPPRLSRLRTVLSVQCGAALVWSLLWVTVSQGVLYGVSMLLDRPDVAERVTASRGSLFAVGVLFYFLVSVFHYLLISQQQIRYAEQQQAVLTLAARDAELRALRAQVQPHFLFNSLNAISSLATRDGERAREMCIALAEFLRLTLGSSDQRDIALADELTLVRHYLAVERIRFGARLRVVEEIESDTTTLNIPPCLLQPLVENAVRHGIATLESGGTLLITSRRDGGYLALSVVNPIDPLSQQRRGGYGLANVRARINARFGKDGLVYTERLDATFRAVVRLPLEACV